MEIESDSSFTAALVQILVEPILSVWVRVLFAIAVLMEVADAAAIFRMSSRGCFNLRQEM